MLRPASRLVLALALLARGARATAAAAEPPGNAVDPAVVAGVVRPAEEPSDVGRDAASRVLWLPRTVVELLFFTSGMAAGLFEDEQVVPRAKEVFFTHGGAFGVFPTLFVETGTTPNAGARMVAHSGATATSLRGGYGGEDENVVESRLRFGTLLPVPGVLSLEALHDRRTGIGYLGLGQTPETDARNHFVGDLRAGVLRERRERAIVGLGLRPESDVELLVSGSYTQRFVDDPHDAGADGVTQVFAGDSLPGVLRTTRTVYGEFAARYDSRATRAAIASGELLEVYVGEGAGVDDGDARFVRSGARAAAFFPVMRRTNVISPKLVLDTLAHAGGGATPFRELPGQPTFRGMASRRDAVSAVGSLDYRWQLMRFVAARLFVDAATVAPRLDELSLDRLRWAAGFGIDLHTSGSELGRVALAASPDGFSFLLSLGVPAGFGDRQHRD